MRHQTCVLRLIRCLLVCGLQRLVGGGVFRSFMQLLPESSAHSVADTCFDRRGAQLRLPYDIALKAVGHAPCLRKGGARS